MKGHHDADLILGEVLSYHILMIKTSVISQNNQNVENDNFNFMEDI